MSDVVLVHGTTQNAAGFAPLVSVLRDRGHRALTVDVPSGAPGTIAEHAEILAAQLPDDLERPVVLAHSAGGLLLPALARVLDARHQVWIAAAVADHAGRRSLLDEIREDPDAVIQPEWRGVDPTGDPAAANRFLLDDTDPDTLTAAMPSMVYTDISPLWSQIPVEDPARLPSTYLLPTRDRTLQIAWMQRAARQRLGVEPVLIEAGHNCYVTHPRATAEAIPA